jgi:hypothetical protein
MVAHQQDDQNLRLTAPAEVAAIVADPSWLAWRYDVRRDELHFLWLPREAHRSVAFLSDPELAASAPRRIVPRQSAAEVRHEQAPLHLILHSGLAGSTLLARALDEEGAVMALKEPPILTDLISHRLNGAPHVPAPLLLAQVAALLARPFAPGEAVVLKMNSVGNLLGPEILAARPDTRALCLHAPLPLFLASLAGRGVPGRLGGRKMFIGLRNSGAADFGFSEKELFELVDLQLGALAWLAVHGILDNAARHPGPPRVRSTDSERLIADPAAALTAIAAHFNIGLDVEALVAGPRLRTHAKTGEPYDASRRLRDLQAAEAAHRSEIGMVAAWAGQVAQAMGLALELPGESAL